MADRPVIPLFVAHELVDAAVRGDDVDVIVDRWAGFSAGDVVLVAVTGAGDG